MADRVLPAWKVSEVDLSVLIFVTLLLRARPVGVPLLLLQAADGINWLKIVLVEEVSSLLWLVAQSAALESSHLM